MATTEQYDAVIIGAGQAGGPFSTTLAESLNNLFMALDNQERKTCYYPNR